MDTFLFWKKATLLLPSKILEQAGLMSPPITQLMHELNRAGLNLNSEIITLDEAEKEICKILT